MKSEPGIDDIIIALSVESHAKINPAWNSFGDSEAAVNLQSECVSKTFGVPAGVFIRSTSPNSSTSLARRLEFEDKSERIKCWISFAQSVLAAVEYVAKHIYATTLEDKMTYHALVNPWKERDAEVGCRHRLVGQVHELELVLAVQDSICFLFDGLADS
jgi:hypothetical protein